MSGEIWERWAPGKAAVRHDLRAAVAAFDAGSSHPAGVRAASWLRDEALANHPASITWLMLVDDELVGYFALASGAVELRRRDRSRLGVDVDRAVQPASLVAQIAKSREAPPGTGDRLIEQAFALAREAAQIQGSVALVVDPFDEETERMWRTKFGFRSSAKLVGGRRRLWLPLFYD